MREGAGELAQDAVHRDDALAPGGRVGGAEGRPVLFAQAIDRGDQGGHSGADGLDDVLVQLGADLDVDDPRLRAHELQQDVVHGLQGQEPQELLPDALGIERTDHDEAVVPADDAALELVAGGGELVHQVQLLALRELPAGLLGAGGDHELETSVGGAEHEAGAVGGGGAAVGHRCLFSTRAM